MYLLYFFQLNGKPAVGNSTLEGKAIRRSDRVHVSISPLQTCISESELNRPNLKVFVSNVKGRGIVTTKGIPAGMTVCEYEHSGGLFDKAAVDAKEEEYAKQGITEGYFFKINKTKYIDATPEVNSSAGRLINHAPKKFGNLDTKHVVDGFGRKRLFLRARRDIDANRELLYNYGYEGKSDKPPPFINQITTPILVDPRFHFELSQATELKKNVPIESVLIEKPCIYLVSQEQNQSDENKELVSTSVATAFDSMTLTSALQRRFNQGAANGENDSNEQGREGNDKVCLNNVHFNL
jgi:hypothetical protein